MRLPPSAEQGTLRPHADRRSASIALVSPKEGSVREDPSGMMAYCLRKTGAIKPVAKARNDIQYVFALA